MDGPDLTKSTYVRSTNEAAAKIQFRIWAEQNKLLDGLTLYPGHPLADPQPESIMQEAHRIINGERDGAYGHPTDNFKTIGELWSVILSFQHGTHVDVSSHDVAMMMVAMKVARNLNRPSRDNLVDVAGYAGCAAKIVGFDQ